MSRYFNSIGNAIFREDPLKERVDIDENGNIDIPFSAGVVNRPVIHTVMINTLSTFQSFGVPFSICDEEAIDIVYGDMLREDFDISDKLNYSALTLMPSEIFSISKRNFMNFVRERILVSYKANLVTMHPDWVMRRCFINNQGWSKYKRDYVDHKLEEMRTINGGGGAAKYLYGGNS